MAEHKCFERVNAKLEPEGLSLPMITMLNMETGRGRETPFMQTERIRPASRVKRRKIVPTYCPFCGKKLKAA